MKTRSRITRGGQVSIPASVRRRWATDRVVIEDQGDAVIVRPLPADPLAAAIGSLRMPDGMTTDQLRARARAEDGAAEIRRGPA
jgi:bifunctional DNA-binding transcriptional regulator/antitoxin component of YhaV-PrlF toxin-antitoxin module